MTFKEKVISGLQHCTGYMVNEKTCAGCPYMGQTTCSLVLMVDAAKLLKAKNK